MLTKARPINFVHPRLNNISILIHGKTPHGNSIKKITPTVFILLPRGVFPRIRIDMLLSLGWTKLIGLAFVNIFIALALVYAGVLGPGGLQ
jgi:NADH:ubiquinone oxidoreductase subunit H